MTREEWIERFDTLPRTGPHPLWFAASGDYFDAWERTAQIMVSLGILREGERVLDLGCAYGGLARYVADHADERQSYLGIDADKATLEHAARIYADVPTVTLQHMDVRNSFYNPGGKIRPETATLPLPDGSVSLVVCQSFFTHTGPEAVAVRYLGEIRRVLAAGGHVFSTWFRNPPLPAQAWAVKSVYPEDFILDLFGAWEIVDAAGGTTAEPNDQWRIVARK